MNHRRSIGQMLTGEGEQAVSAKNVKKACKLAKIAAGLHVACTLELPGKRCGVGRARTVTRAQSEVVLHVYRPVTDGRLQVHWEPVYKNSSEEGARESLGDDPRNHAGRPVVEAVPAKRLLCVVHQLNLPALGGEGVDSPKGSGPL